MKTNVHAAIILLTSLGFSACGFNKRPDRIDSKSSPRVGSNANQGADGADGESGPAAEKQPVLGDSLANDPLAKDGTDFFPAAATEAPRKRIFRLTHTQFDETIKFLLPTLTVEPISKHLPIDPKQTNYDYADFLLFNAANFSPYAKWVEGIANVVKANPEAALNCKATPPVVACHTEEATKLVHRAFRGAEDAAVEAKYVAFFQSDLNAQVPYAQAVANLVTNLLYAPSFAFRAEFATEADALIPGEQRQNLAFTAADAPIESLIGADAKKAEADQMDKVLQSPKTKAKLQRFFMDWLEIKKPGEFRVAKENFPEFTDAFAAASVEEMKNFLDYYLNQPAPKLSELLTSRKSFATAATNAAYVADEGKGQNPEHDAKKRLGIFTQPAFIASRSGPIENGIIKRGVFFMRKAMCLETGAVPQGIDIKLPENPGTSEREQVEAKTSITPCSNCHQVINPLGYAFENFDVMGRWRTEEHGAAVDASITMDFLGDAGAKTETSVEALEFLTKSDRFKQCFVRQMFRFYMGRNEASSDDPTLKAMFTQLKESDDIMSLLKAMLGSDRFQTRR